MLPAPKRLEIDHRTLKLIVGVIALTLAGATWLFAGTDIESISASFWQGGWSQSFFVGSLFAVSAFLLAYNGFSRPEMILSKVAAVAGLGVALFPCGCEGHPEIAPPLHGPAGSRLAPAVHGLSAAVMFVILAYFCYGFFHRARAKGHSQAQGSRGDLRDLWGCHTAVDPRAGPPRPLAQQAGRPLHVLRRSSGPHRVRNLVADGEPRAPRGHAPGRAVLPARGSRPTARLVGDLRRLPVAPRAVRVRVWHLMSRGRAPGGGQPPLEGSSVGYPPSSNPERMTRRRPVKSTNRPLSQPMSASGPRDDTHDLA